MSTAKKTGLPQSVRPEVFGQYDRWLLECLNSFRKDPDPAGYRDIIDAFRFLYQDDAFGNRLINKALGEAFGKTHKDPRHPKELHLNGFTGVPETKL